MGRTLKGALFSHIYFNPSHEALFPAYDAARQEDAFLKTVENLHDYVPQSLKHLAIDSNGWNFIARAHMYEGSGVRIPEGG